MATTFTDKMVVYDTATARYLKADATDTIAISLLQVGNGTSGSLVIDTGAAANLTILETGLARTGADIAINPGAANKVTTNGSLEVAVDLSVTSNVAIGGNLVVAGDIVAKSQQNVLVRDSFLDLNAGNYTTSAAASGFTSQVRVGTNFNVANGRIPIDVIEFHASGAATGGGAFLEVASGDEAKFAADDIIAISAADGLASGNNGLFAVANVTTAGEIALKSAPNAQAPFLQTALVSAISTTQAKVFGVNLSAFALSNGVLSSGTAIAAGTPCYAYYEDAEDTDFTTGWTDMASVTVSLQSAYDGGNAILMTASDGAFDVSPSGAEVVAFSIDGSAASNVSVTGNTLTLSTLTSGDLTASSAAALYLTAANKFELTGSANSLIQVTNANLSVKTLTAGALDVTSAAALDIDAVGALSLNSSTAAINIGNDAVAQAINIGTGGAARTITVGNATGATEVEVNTGTGGFDVNALGAVTIDGQGASNLSIASGNLTIATTGTGDVLIDGIDGVEINSGSGTIEIGQDANTGAINIGTGASARTISIGSTSSTSASMAASGDVSLTSDDENVVLTATATAKYVKLQSNTLFAKAGGIDSDVSGALAGEAVYFDGTNYVKSECDSATSAARDVDGIVLNATDGTVATVDGTIVHCVFTSAPTAGAIAYLSATAGALTTTAPTASANRVFKVGRVLSATAVDSKYPVVLQKQYLIDIN